MVQVESCNYSGFVKSFDLNGTDMHNCILLQILFITKLSVVYNVVLFSVVFILIA